MNSKSITFFLVCLLLCGLTTAARACPPPECPNCYYWNGYECYCHEACCIDADCTGECDYCSDSCVCEDDQSLCPGECDYCWAGYCYDDDTKCSGCCGCEDGECVDDQSQCSGCCKCQNCACLDDQSKCAAPKVCAGCECICVGCELKSVDFCRLMQSNCRCYYFTSVPPSPSPCPDYTDIDPGVVWDCELACNDKTCDYDGKAVCYSYRLCKDSGNLQPGKYCSIDGTEGYCKFWPLTICVTCIPTGPTYFNEVTNFKCE